MLIQYVDELQEELTGRYIHSNLERIMQDLLKLRLNLDLEFQTYRSKKNKTQLGFAFDFDKFIFSYSDAHLETYPLGLCKFIADLIREYILCSNNPFRLEGINIINDFRAAGGVFKPVWGEVRGKYFQNAFQAGSMYLDVANDTVHLDKPKVASAPINDCDFGNIVSFESYASIIRSYWQQEVYVNDCFPELLPFFPLLRKPSKDTHILIDFKLIMSSLVWREGLDSVLPLYEKSTFEKQLLPPDDRAMLAANLKRLKGNEFLLNQLGFEQLDRQRLVESLLQFKDWGTEALKSRYDEVKGAVKLFNDLQLFRSHDNFKDLLA